MGGPEGIWEGAGASWAGHGAFIARWERLRRFRRRLEANLKRLGGFRKPFEGAKGRPRLRFESVQGCFCSVFWCAFEVASKN